MDSGAIETPSYSLSSALVYCLAQELVGMNEAQLGGWLLGKDRRVSFILEHFHPRWLKCITF